MRATRARGDKTMSLDEAVRRLSQNHPQVPPEVLRLRAEQLTKEASDGSGRRVWGFDPLHRTTSPVAFSVERWKAHAARITAPTLIVGGGKTGFHPTDEAERIATLALRTHVEIEDAGHMMHWTRPERLAEILRDFVAQNA